MHLVIDGGSLDGTIDVIKSYDAQISHWVSEVDDGIYDAMNKKISRASGLFLNFMNAGDVFLVTARLEICFSAARLNLLLDADVIYGNHVVLSSRKPKMVTPRAISDFLRFGECVFAIKVLLLLQNYKEPTFITFKIKSPLILQILLFRISSRKKFCIF